jgi:DNA transformation protein and related proteins
MSLNADYLAYVIDQLSSFAVVTARRMFGGAGLYSDGVFFALIYDDTLYFKVDESNREDYLERGCVPFQPYAERGNAVVMNYYSVPPEVLEDNEELAVWARKACRIATARAATKKKAPARAKPRVSARPRAPRRP